MAGAFILQLRDTMSLRTADVGSVCVRARSFWLEECHVWIGDWKRGAAGSGAAWGRLGGMLDRSPSSRRRDGSARWRWREEARAALLLRIRRCNYPPKLGAPKTCADPRPPTAHSFHRLSRYTCMPPAALHPNSTGSGARPPPPMSK